MRPYRLGEADLGRLEGNLVQNCFLLLLSVTGLFIASGSVSVCALSVRSDTKLIGFWNRSAVRKPFIREANPVERTEWAVRYHLWDMTQWSLVIFTDESSFWLDR